MMKPVRELTFAASLLVFTRRDFEIYGKNLPKKATKKPDTI